jgi:hypothetical protein
LKSIANVLITLRVMELGAIVGEKMVPAEVVQHHHAERDEYIAAVNGLDSRNALASSRRNFGIRQGFVKPGNSANFYRSAKKTPIRVLQRKGIFSGVCGRFSRC